MRCSSGPRCTSRPERDRDAPGGALRYDREGCAARPAVCFEPAAVGGEYGVQPQCISEGHQGRVSVVHWHVGVAPHEQRDLGVQAAIEAETLLAANQRLNTAYLLKESFGRLWDFTYAGCARRFWENWKAQLKWQRMPAYRKFIKLVEGHWDGILAFCDKKVSLGYIESANLKARNVIRRAYGYRDKEYMKLKIIQACTPWMAEFHPWAVAHSIPP